MAARFSDIKDLKDLKNRIYEKSVILSSVGNGSRANRDEIVKTEKELDYLLYLYYKSISEKCGDKLVC